MAALKLPTPLTMAVPMKTEIPRLGVNMQLSSSLENVEWYGRGPHENYIDRKASAFMGSYSAKVNEMKFDYGRPQENGYRTQTKQLSITDQDGVGLQFMGLPEFSFAVHNNTTDDYDDGAWKNSKEKMRLEILKTVILTILNQEIC